MYVFVSLFSFYSLEVFPYRNLSVRKSPRVSFKLIDHQTIIYVYIIEFT